MYQPPEREISTVHAGICHPRDFTPSFVDASGDSSILVDRSLFRRKDGFFCRHKQWIPAFAGMTSNSHCIRRFSPPRQDFFRKSGILLFFC
jgi:hypothetical protein